MRNEKGVVFFTLLTFPGVIHLIFLATALACIWHVPAWSKAKANHTEAQYQSQVMWPQVPLSMLPGGDAPAHTVLVLQGNGGNFPGGSTGIGQ